jgi:cell division septation protein DedD
MVLPTEPVTVSDVVLGGAEAPPPSSRPPGPGRPQAGGTRSAQGSGYVVQIGAFRLRSNALELVDNARRSGIVVGMVDEGDLIVVRTAPYSSREQATEVAARLVQARLDAVVLPSP